MGIQLKVRELLLNNLSTVKEAVEYIARRRSLSSEQKEEFSQYAHLKLMEDDCAIMRRFKGDSSLRTYLVTVLNHLFLDYRTKEWGKWRPSAKAKKLGIVAEKLEALCYRDGYDFACAANILRINHRVEMSRDQLADLFVQLRPRFGRNKVGDDDLELVSDPSGTAEEWLLGRERERALKEVEETLEGCLRQLQVEDRMIVRMRFRDGIQVSEIARVTGCRQKSLYRRFEKLYRGLRRCMERRGVSADDVGEVLREPRESGQTRPSGGKNGKLSV